MWNHEEKMKDMLWNKTSENSSFHNQKNKVDQNSCSKANARKGGNKAIKKNDNPKREKRESISVASMWKSGFFLVFPFRIILIFVLIRKIHQDGFDFFIREQRHDRLHSQFDFYCSPFRSFPLVMKTFTFWTLGGLRSTNASIKMAANVTPANVVKITARPLLYCKS